DPDPPLLYELLGEPALRAYRCDRIGAEERVAAEMRVVRDAVEQREERQALKPGARGKRLGHGDELVDERRGLAHRRPPPFARPRLSPAPARLRAGAWGSFTGS